MPPCLSLNNTFVYKSITDKYENKPVEEQTVGLATVESFSSACLCLKRAFTSFFETVKQEPLGGGENATNTNGAAMVKQHSENSGSEMSKMSRILVNYIFVSQK